jgi:hypothetical protein
VLSPGASCFTCASALCHDRLEAVVGRIGPERRQAVDRNAAPGGVEPRLGEAERGGAVGDMPLQMRELPRCVREPLDLLSCESGVGVGRCQVRHEPDDVPTQGRELREPVSPHTGLELDVHPHAFGNLAAADRQLEAGLAGLSDLVGRRRRS